MNLSLLLFIIVFVIGILIMLPTSNDIQPHTNCNDPACYMTKDCGGFTNDDE